MEDAFTQWPAQSSTPDRQWTRSEKPKIRCGALPGGSPIFREWHRSTMADSPPIRWKMLSHGGWLFCHCSPKPIPMGDFYIRRYLLDDEDDDHNGACHVYPNPGVTFLSDGRQRFYPMADSSVQWVTLPRQLWRGWWCWWWWWWCCWWWCCSWWWWLFSSMGDSPTPTLIPANLSHAANNCEYIHTEKDIIKYTWNVYLGICEFLCLCLCVFEYLYTTFDPSQSQPPHIQLRTDRWKENWKSRVEKCQSNPLSSNQPHHYKTVNPTSSPLRPPIRTVASIKDISMELVGQSL